MAEQKRAINPYNFIPFEGAPERKPLDDYFQGPLESGWIDVRLTVKTPLIIPDGAKYKASRVSYQTAQGDTKIGEHKEFSFFRVPTEPESVPTIPGSSLRGMLRSVYEAASNSCLPFLERKPITQRTMTYASFKKRGVLVFEPGNSGCKLYGADVYKYKIKRSEIERTGQFRRFDNATQIRFRGRYGTLDAGSLEFLSDETLQEGMLEGVLQFNIPAVSPDYNVAALVPCGRPLLLWRPNGIDSETEEQSSPYQLMFAAVYDTLQNISGDQEKRASRGIEVTSAARPMQALLKALETAKKEGGMIPCYYQEVERGNQTLYYFSPSSIGRVRQRRSWSEIMGAYSPCTDLDGRETASTPYNHHTGVCPACALFGTMDTKHIDGDARGAKGHLRFTDAQPDPEKHPNRQVETLNCTLPILGDPKPTAFEFYLRKPADNAAFWNFDYYGEKRRDGAYYYDIPEATPRGRKMYWHGKPITAKLDSLDRPDLSATMEAAAPNSEFLFRVYFDRISAQQRQDLLWLLTLGENRKDSPLQFKLGHAKPVGYGSVKLTVEHCVRRTVRTEPETAVVLDQLLTEPESTSFLPGRLAIRSLLRMCDARTAQGQWIDYPTARRKLDESWQIYTWFAVNRINPDQTQVLPEPVAEDLTMPTRIEKLRKQKTDSFKKENDYRSGKKNNRPGPTPDELKEAEKLIGSVTEARVTYVNGQKYYAWLSLSGTNVSGYCYFRNMPAPEYKARVKVRVLKVDWDRKNIMVEIVK